MTTKQVLDLPQFVDGSGGSMWPARTGTASPSLERCFVRLSDVLRLVQSGPCQCEIYQFCMQCEPEKYQEEIKKSHDHEI